MGKTETGGSVHGTLTDVGREHWADRSGPVRRYEALGRVMAALTQDGELFDACRDLTWWRREHSWYLEWRDGPFASEIADLLIEQVREPSFAGTVAGLVGPATRTQSSLDVMGVRFVLKAIDPLGRERIIGRSTLWRMREALDTSRRNGAKRPWEQLLGG